MDGRYRHAGQNYHQRDEDDVALREQTKCKQVDKSDHGKKKDDAENDVGNIDDRRRKIGPATPVDDIVDKTKEGIGDTDEQGGHKGTVRAIERGGGIGIHSF